MFWHIDTDMVALLVMGALYYYTVRMLPGDAYTARSRGFVWCLRVGVCTTLIDIASSVVMDAPISRFAYHFFMTAYMLTQDLVVVSWFLYALTILFERDEPGRRRAVGAAVLIYAVYCLLALTNPWSGLFFTLGPNLEYARGPLFLPGLVGLNYLYAAALLLLVWLRRKQIPAEYPKIVLVLQPIILSVAIWMQLTHPGWLLIDSAYMVCLVLAFLFFQNVRVRGERARLRQLGEMVEHFACGMSICRVAPGRDMEIQYLSGGMASICDAEAEELTRRMRADIFTGVHPEDRALVKSRVDEMSRSPAPQEITYRYVTDAGAIKWINLRAEAVPAGNGSATVYATYTDLTELKKAEQLIDVALFNTGVSIWEYDFSRRCIIQYQNSTQMHGFEKIVPDVPNSLVESGFVHPDSADAFLEMYEKLFAGAPFAEGVFKVRTSDRRGYWYEHIRYTNSFDNNGKPYRAVGMSTDETQRQEALEKYERELEKERGFMAEEGLIAHATIDLSTGETLDYRYRDGSEVPERDRTTFARAAARAPLLIDESERARFLELNDAERLLRYFEAGETELRQEYRRMLPDGMVTWVRNTLRMLRDPRTRDVLLFEYWYDIESEKMLELMYRSIATDNYDFVARIDGRTRRFDAIEKAGLADHMPPSRGDDADKVTMALFNERVPVEDRATAMENSLIDNVRAHLRESGRFVFTYRVTDSDGSLRHKRITQYFIDPQREIIAVLREDVTDLIQKEAEKNRVLSEALEAANQASRAKSQFLSRVSHELRTPLNAIIGFMELAKGADAKKVETYLANADAAAKQLLSIINDVLDMSSIESGKLKIAHAPFDFRQLLQGVTDLYLTQCRRKGLIYETLLVTPVDEWLMGDPLRVNQILLNLLNNALKFTERGRVCLSVSQKPARGDQVVVRFEVSDTGCGMSEEMRGRLFKPFEQESAVTAQKYGGNGLGLSIVGSLTAMMGGVVSVRSEQGVGSTFTVDIPFVQTRAENTAVEIEGAERLRVLAVDDEPIERTYVSAVLERLNVRHACARDGAGALDELARANASGDMFNVCLVDWKMPDMNGLEITRRIRAMYGSELVVIVVSAYDHYQADESAKAAGANMFISKPLFQSSLFDLFATLTGGRIARREETSAPADLSDMRVLLAEDNAMNRMVAENLILTKFGCACDCAEDGQIALDRFLASPEGYYDAILMDIQMPNMDGFEATRRIRASGHPDAKNVPIIALTANAFSEDVAKSLACGMNAHVSKPIEPDVLGAALAKAYARRGRETGD